MNIPPQQELEDLALAMYGYIPRKYAGSWTEVKKVHQLIAQTRTDTIRELEDQHQLALAQSKLAIYKKVQKTLQAGQLPVVATVFDAEITQLEREMSELTKLTGKEIR